MLIKYLLNGKTIDLTSDIIKIQSKNFSVDETGKVTATEGEIGGFDMTVDELSSDLYSSYIYSQADLDKIRDYIMGTATLAAAEIELYDVDRNGTVDAVDYMMIGNYIATGTSKDNPGKVKWTNGDVFNTFTIRDGTGNQIVNLNAFRNYINTLFSSSINTNRIIAGNIQYGFVDITPKANIPTSIEILFNNQYSEPPIVVASAETGAPGTDVKGATPSNVDTTGFSLYLTRSNTATTRVFWLAIG